MRNWTLFLGGLCFLFFSRSAFAKRTNPQWVPKKIAPKKIVEQAIQSMEIALQRMENWLGRAQNANNQWLIQCVDSRLSGVKGILPMALNARSEFHWEPLGSIARKQAFDRIILSKKFTMARYSEALVCVKYSEKL